MNNDINLKFNHLECEKKASEKLLNIQQKINQNIDLNSNIFSILLPPPNVTGKLHLGHAWNVTIQDFLIRYNQLYNKKAYWICGMDHAGIATQTKYEKHIRIEKKEKLSNDRSKNIEDLYKWSQINANQIRNQWKKIGCFLDYENEWFTLQKEANDIVMSTFVKMYNDNLIYRAKKIVNWDWKLKTAISNVEVIKKETNTKLYSIKYYFEHDKTNYLVVATTRPETIFVDAAVFVNPKDKRYQNLNNKYLINPLTKEKLPIIYDEYVDLEFGTGVMKCTPAHDFADYDLGIKYNLSVESCFNEDGTTNELAKGFEGLKINDARSKVVEYLKINNLLIEEKETISNVGYSERTGVIVEPMVSYQWFIRMSEYAKKIIDLQETDKKINFYPIKFEKTLINWLTNINDWCISRQLWWGHQIPVWYKKNSDEIYVGTTPPKNEQDYYRDNDVLDTWFSSGLWPIIVSSGKKENLSKFPTNVLVTGFDIIFFWVSRMIFFSLYSRNKIPFKNVYITGLIRDEQNRKMSKSLGNGIDPNDVIEKYGADALRLFLLSSSSPGEDLIYSEQKVKWCWGFVNKLWNSFRYISIKCSNYVFDQENKPKEFSEFDKWILSKFNNLYIEFNNQVKNYNFLIAIKKITDFVWNLFCNDYIELTKNRKINIDSYYWTMNYIFKNIVLLIHPICPFVSCELYDAHNFKNKKKNILFDSLDLELINTKKSPKIDNVLLLINKIRTYNFENKISKNKKIKIKLICNNDFCLDNELIDILNCSNIYLNESIDTTSRTPDFVEESFSIFVEPDINKIENSINLEKINKEIKKLEFEITRCDSMLNNQNFINKAPKSKIDEEKQKKEKHIQKMNELLEIKKQHQ